GPGQSQRRSGDGAPAGPERRWSDDRAGHPRRQAGRPLRAAGAHAPRRQGGRRLAPRPPALGRGNRAHDHRRGEAGPMRAVLAKGAAHVRRRRLQTVLVALTTLVASCTATTSLTLLARTSAPFEQVFERVSGPHLILHPDAARVSTEQLRATASLPVVVAAGDPHRIALVPIQVGERKTRVELVERDDPGGRGARLQLVAGRWVQGPGEIVVPRFDAPEAGELKIVVGETVRVLSRADRPAFRVVGEVVDVGEYSG